MGILLIEEKKTFSFRIVLFCAAFGAGGHTKDEEGLKLSCILPEFRDGERVTNNKFLSKREYG